MSFFKDKILSASKLCNYLRVDENIEKMISLFFVVFVMSFYWWYILHIYKEAFPVPKQEQIWSFDGSISNS